MKKIMMTMVAAMAALTMNAQGMYVGGSLGLSTQSYDGSTQNTSISFNPHFGISFNENMGVGFEMGYSHYNDESHKEGENGYKDKRNTISVSPYFRYTALRFGKVAVFADGMFTYSTSTTKREFNKVGNVNTDYTTNAFGLYVKPGISYSVNEKIGLTARLGNLFGFTSSKPDTEGAKSTTTLQFMNLSNAVNFGVFYKF